jgi:hypothetical protein
MGLETSKSFQKKPQQTSVGEKNHQPMFILQQIIGRETG